MRLVGMLTIVTVARGPLASIDFQYDSIIRALRPLGEEPSMIFASILIVMGTWIDCWNGWIQSQCSKAPPREVKLRRQLRRLRSAQQVGKRTSQEESMSQHSDGIQDSWQPNRPADLLGLQGEGEDMLPRRDSRPMSFPFASN